MSLAEFAQDTEYQGATLTIVNPDSECPLYRLLAGLFDDDVVTIQEATTESGSVQSDTVLVEKDGRDAGFAVSSFESIRDELLLVNSDIYVTGHRELDDVETPDAIRQLDEIPFTVTGYPENSKEKLLLIEISRHIEAMAWQAGNGRLASGVQYLSRLDDEHGTQQVYTRLGSETAVETHVYGVPDSHPSIPNVTLHGETTEELRKSWFVVYESARYPHEAAALVAMQTDANTWEGCWTYDPNKVAGILDHLDRTYD